MNNVMTLAEKYRQKKEALAADIEKCKREIDSLKAQLDEVDVAFAEAVDKNENDKLHELAKKKFDIRVNIEIQEQIIKRKSQPDYLRNDAASEWNAELENRQIEVNAKAKKAVKALNDAIATALDLAEDVSAAKHDRYELLTVLGDNYAASVSFQNKDFNAVKYDAAFFKAMSTPKLGTFIAAIDKDGKTKLEKNANDVWTI